MIFYLLYWADFSIIEKYFKKRGGFWKFWEYSYGREQKIPK